MQSRKDCNFGLSDCQGRIDGVLKELRTKAASLNDRRVQGLQFCSLSKSWNHSGVGMMLSLIKAYGSSLRFEVRSSRN